jgi:hypothetical protein
MHEVSDDEIAADIRRTAKRLGVIQLSRSQYLQHGKFSQHQIYDGGRNWDSLCVAAGINSLKVKAVGDDIYFERLKLAVNELNRFPTVNERKKFGLNFSKRRYPTLTAFIERAIELRVIAAPPQRKTKPPVTPGLLPPKGLVAIGDSVPLSSAQRPVPPIPTHTRRTKWERTGIDGFPYAPQDELGVVALFGILCATGVIPWQILELRGGKGIDTTCFDHATQKEIHVELKHTLSRTGWNHNGLLLVQWTPT